MDPSRQFEWILSSAVEGIFGLDLEGRIFFINPSGEKLLGFSPGELQGQLVQKILRSPHLHSNEEIESESLIYNSLKNVSTCSGKQHEFWRRDGTSFPAEFTCASIVEGESIMGSVVTFRDIQDRLQVDRALKNYAFDLASRNTDLKNFTFVASHDLQEPLRKVLMLSDRLETDLGESLNDRSRGYVKRIKNSAGLMQQLLYDLLEYFQSTTRESNIETVNLNEEINHVLFAMKRHLQAVDAEVKIGPLPEIEGSRFQVRQLFKHLIGNGIKFSKAGTPPKIDISAREESPTHWRITVTDQGIGFDEKYLDRIFRPFQKLHGKTEYSGSGIGLAICEKIVTRHRGTVTACSQPGQGAQFIIILPRKLFEGATPSNSFSQI